MSIKLSKDRRDELGTELLEFIDQAIEDSSAWRDLVQQGRALYYGQKERTNSPWPGASDMHLPIVQEKVEGMVPKLVNAFWGSEPVVNVERVPEEFNEDDTRKCETFFNWVIVEDVPELYGVTENWFRDTARDGVSYLKPVWVRRWRNTQEHRSLKLFTMPGQTTPAGVPVPEEGPPIPKSALEFMLEIFGEPDLFGTRGLLDMKYAGRGTDSPVPESEDLPAPMPVETEPQAGSPLAGREYRVTFAEGRRVFRGIKVEFEASDYIDEINVCIYRPVLIRDGVEVDLIECEDLILPYRAKDIRTAEFVAQQYFLSYREIQKRVRSGEWEISEDDLTRLKAHLSEAVEENEDNASMGRQKDAVTGESSTKSRSRTLGRDNKALCYELHRAEDLDGDGTDSDIVYDVVDFLSSVVRARHLEEVFPHGRRPFVDLHYQPISNRFHSMGLGTLLAAINIECNAIVNFVNDSQELINNPFFFYVPAATTAEPKMLSGIGPGQGIPVMDINGVLFPKFASEPLANLQALDTMLLFADRLTISPMNSGSSQVRNAPRTARGTLALLSEGNVKLDIFITRAQRTGWKELLQQIMGLYQAFMPEEKWFWVNREMRERERISPNEIRGRYEFYFKGNSVNTNREVMRTIAQMRYNMAAADPLYAQDPERRLALLEDFLRHNSEGVDVDKLLPRLPGMGGLSHPPLDQKAENQIMSLGHHVDVLPVDNHVEHLAELERFASNKAFEAIEPRFVQMFAVHKRQHMELLQHQRSQAVGLPPGGTQGNNVPVGMTMDTGMSGLEGGVTQ